MKDSECLLFMEVALENGSDVHQAIQDMKMIDNLLLAERNHFLAFGAVKKTSRGYFRKNSSLSKTIENIVEARAANIEM